MAVMGTPRRYRPAAEHVAASSCQAAQPAASLGRKKGVRLYLENANRRLATRVTSSRAT
jgi:hypothetical protein